MFRLKKKIVIIFIFFFSFILSSNVVLGFQFNFGREELDLGQEVVFDYKEYFFQRPEINLIEESAAEFLDFDLVSYNYAHESKGIYINAWSAGNMNRMEEFIDSIKDSELNSVVIDIKDATGRITFMSKDIIETPEPTIYDLEYLISRLKEEGIYVIGRVVLFQDHSLALKGPEYSLTYQLNDSDIMINSTKWVNPYEYKVWNYNLNIAETAIEYGVDEIKFDYIRFPTLATDSKLSIETDGARSKSDVILGFLEYANYRFEPYDVFISTDVYGLTTTVEGDLGIGQDITKMKEYVDFICPMIYPSHYNPGVYGIEDPDADPYKLIKRSLEDAKEKLGDESHKLRPWLQDFSLKSRYTEKEIREQIRAVEDLDIEGWTFWSPSSNYTIEAFE